MGPLAHARILSLVSEALPPCSPRSRAWGPAFSTPSRHLTPFDRDRPEGRGAPTLLSRWALILSGAILWSIIFQSYVAPLPTFGMSFVFNLT